MKQKALTATAAVIGLSVLSFAPTAAQARIAAQSPRPQSPRRLRRP
jgi:hypothetical protein